MSQNFRILSSDELQEFESLYYRFMSERIQFESVDDSVSPETADTDVYIPARLLSNYHTRRVRVWRHGEMLQKDFEKDRTRMTDVDLFMVNGLLRDLEWLNTVLYGDYHSSRDAASVGLFHIVTKSQQPPISALQQCLVTAKLFLFGRTCDVV